MLTFAAKSPREVVPGEFIWSTALPRDEIEGFELIVTKGEIEVDNERKEGKSVIFDILGGKRGEIAVIQCLVMTVNGNRYEESASIAIN